MHDWTSTTINGAAQARIHGPAHEILTMDGAAVPNASATLQHDTKGNITSDDRGTNLAWDFDNMFETFGANSVLDLKDADYTYDAIGRRVSKAVRQPDASAKTTLFIHAGQQVTCEYAPASTTSNSDRKYIYANYTDDPLLFVHTNATIDMKYYVHRNRQYSIYSVTDEAGLAMEYYGYSPNGAHETVSATGTVLGSSTVASHNLLFTGRNIDTESRLYYFRARMLSTQLGRFVGRDPIGFADGWNLSQNYFGMHGVDPTGTEVPYYNDRIVKECESKLWRWVGNGLAQAAHGLSCAGCLTRQFLTGGGDSSSCRSSCSKSLQHLAQTNDGFMNAILGSVSLSCGQTQKTTFENQPRDILFRKEGKLGNDGYWSFKNAKIVVSGQMTSSCDERRYHSYWNGDSGCCCNCNVGGQLSGTLTDKTDYCGNLKPGGEMGREFGFAKCGCILEDWAKKNPEKANGRFRGFDNEIPFDFTMSRQVLSCPGRSKVEGGSSGKPGSDNPWIRL